MKMGPNRKYWRCLRKQLPKIIHCVPAFTIQSYQENTCVAPPPSLDVWSPRKFCSLFRSYYLRGDIPVARCYRKDCPRSQYLIWRQHPQELDYSYYLPIFFEGLCESDFPFRELAIYGVSDLIRFGDPRQILGCVPQLILPIKKALNTRIPCCIVAACKAIQQLVMTVPCTGQALVPFYRKILPILNQFRGCNVTLCDHIEYNRFGELGDVIDRTLNIMEQHGGPDAYINMKFMVPTYESCVMN